MRILLTGASSFTGAWIASTLSRQGHEVIAIFGRHRDGYDSERSARVNWIADRIEAHFETEFGSEKFVSIADDAKADLLALHGAEVRNYRSWDFDAIGATAANVRNIRPILESFAKTGQSVVYTGSVFEPYEGIGDPDRAAVNPYGLSKHMTYEVLRLEAARTGLSLRKFVIPNPFGPYEEPRFTSYLIRENHAGRRPTIATPAYVRDNIHVDLMAESYAWFAASEAASGLPSFRPSGYIETQGAFGQRFLREIGTRLGKNWGADEAYQQDYSEPRICINDNPAVVVVPTWSETQAWDQLAEYYASGL